MKIPLVWMYAYPCNISVVGNVVTRTYFYSTNLILGGQLCVKLN